MLTAVTSSRFKRDVQKLQKRGKDMRKLSATLRMLIEEEPIPAAYRPDWLPLYRVVDGELQLARTATHSDLFRE